MVIEPEEAKITRHEIFKQANDKSFEELISKVPSKSLERLGLKTMNPLKFLELYDTDISLNELTIDPNANVGNRKSISNRLSEMAKPWMKMRGFQELHEAGMKFFGDKFTLEPIFNGRIYIHDSTKMDRPYCIGVSAMDIVLDGRPYADIEGVPPKHFDAFNGQMTEYFFNLCGEHAGAIASADWLPTMAWYAEKEDIHMKSKEHNRLSIEQSWQHILHILHNKFRVDGDPPYTNISINSPETIKDILGNYVYPDGMGVEDFLDTIMEVQKTVVEFMYKGDPKQGGIQYKFPVMTANFKRSEIGSKWWKSIAAYNNRGMFNICVAEMFSSCCRLLSDFKEMLKYKTYSNGSGGLKIGSHRVVTLNLPGIAHDAGYDMDNFMRLLDESIDQAAMYLFAHKVGMLLPRVKSDYFTFYSEFKTSYGQKTGKGPWLDLNMLFSTIGIHGAPDCLDLLLGSSESILTTRGLNLGKEIVAHIVDRASELSGKMYHDYIDNSGHEKRLNMFFNVEQVPAESASATMASFYGDEMYSNQFVPLDVECDIWDRVEIEGELSNLMTGGSMTFLTLRKLLTPEQSVKFHDRVMDVSDRKLNQFCTNYGWDYCPSENKSWVGFNGHCLSCGGPIRHKERVVGYMVDTETINEPRLQNDLEKRHRAVI